jgi:hypothetical protein
LDNRQEIAINQPGSETDRVSGYVKLPISEEQFGEFVKSLLGSPQAILRKINGEFEVGIDDVCNINALLIQRIQQQNGGMLASFRAKVNYSDDSTVEFESIDSFASYNAIRPVISRAVHLKWDFIVKFPEARSPEKQRIQLSIVPTGDKHVGYDMPEIPFSIFAIQRSGFFSYRIEHTARTWGDDIDNLLTHHLNNIIKKPGAFISFIGKWHDWIGTFVATILIGLIFYTAATASQAFHKLQTQHIAELLRAKRPGLDGLNERVQGIGIFLAEGAWAQFSTRIIFAIFVGVIISLLLGLWISTTLEQERPSFLLLTKESEKHRGTVLRRQKRKWLSFIAAFVVSAISGVVGNYVFTYLTTSVQASPPH